MPCPGPKAGPNPCPSVLIIPPIIEFTVDTSEMDDPYTLPYIINIEVLNCHEFDSKTNEPFDT